MRNKINESRTSWLKDKVSAAAGDSKNLWRTAKQLLHTSKSDIMNDEDRALMCEKFCSFFSEKVSRIRRPTAAAAAVANNCTVPADK